MEINDQFHRVATYTSKLPKIELKSLILAQIER